MLKHGGRLIAASKKYNRPVFDWLDLSTGINPAPYPVPEITADTWRRLPQDDDGLLTAASNYYGTSDLLAISGSQAAIQTIPQLFKKSRVGLSLPGYNEHLHAWQQAGHEIIQIDSTNIAAQCTDLHLDVLLLCNPNNPTGTLVELSELTDCLAVMHKNGGTVIIDEAFMDSTPEKSVIPLLDKYPQNLIVLRSLGKFFGLAGARVGFVAASQQFLDTLKEKLGPWTISGPSRVVAHHALNNTKWQAQNRLFLKTNSKKLCEELISVGFEISGRTDYFAWVKHRDAEFFHDTLCQFGVLTRYFDETSSLRFGLPADNHEFLWLNKGLRHYLLRLG